MNAPQNPSFSDADPAGLDQIDDLLDDLLNLPNSSLEPEERLPSESEGANQDSEPAVLSPFLATREDRGIPEFELNPSEADTQSREESNDELLEPVEAPQSEPVSDDEAIETPELLEEIVLNNAQPVVQLEIQALESQNNKQLEKRIRDVAAPTPLNVRLQNDSKSTSSEAPSDTFLNSLLENPYATVLSSSVPSVVETPTESVSETMSYQDIHQALAKQSKTPFLASPKFWLVLALVGLGTGGGVALWQKANQPRVSFSLSGQDLGTDFLEPGPFASASGSSEAASSPSAGTSIVSSASPSAVPSAGSSASPSARPSIAASATTELLLWARIKQENVNMRSAPGKQASVVLQPKINQKFIMTGQSKRADDLDWAELQLDESKTAWVSTRFIEISPGEKVAAKAPSASTSAESAQPSEASQDEYAQAAKVVAQLLKAPGTVWPQATPELQNLTVLAMLKQIFKDKPDGVTPERIATLQSCLDESVRAENLKKLKVYEIAVACTLALNWR